MRLLREVLGDQLARAVQPTPPIIVHRADHQLGPVDVIDRSARLLCPGLQLLHRLDVVFRLDEIIQHHAVGDFAGQFHHLWAGRPDVDRHVARPFTPVNHVQLDTVDMHVLTVKGHRLGVEKTPHYFYHLAHGRQRAFPVDAYIRRQRVPPRADPADHPVGGEVIEGQKGGGDQGRVARPVVDHARSNLDPLGRCSESGHRYDGITHQPRFSLPYGFEPPFLGIPDILDPVRDRMGVLKIECNSLRH